MNDHDAFREAIADLTRKLLELCGVGSESRVLDLACGTGDLAIAAARLGAREVTAVDARAPLIEIARRRAREERLAIRFEVMEPDALSFPNGSFDVVCCELALSAIRSPLLALQQAKRLLVPEGRLGLTAAGARSANGLFVRAAEALASAGTRVDLDAYFAFSGAERLENLLAFAGFFDVSATPVSGVAHVPDLATYWALISGATGWPIGQGMGSGEAPAGLATSPRGGYSLPFELVLATGRGSPAKSANAPETWKSFVRRISADVEELSPEEVRERAERRACTLIDVRERSEATQMIPGAHLIPRGKLHDEVARLLPDIMAPIVLYSARGERSVAGAAMLERAGYRNVFSMEGGLERWNELGFPVQAAGR